MVSSGTDHRPRRHRRLRAPPRPTLDATQVAWAHVASRWAEMTSPADRTDLDLDVAANELRAAVREVAHDKPTWSRPDVMAGRVDLGEAAQSPPTGPVRRRRRRLRDPRRRRAGHPPHRPGPRNVATGNADIDRTADRGQRGEDVVWVTPGDVYANRTVAISQPVRAGLVDATDTLVQTTSNAMSAAACLDRVSQDRPSGSGQEPTTSRARRHVTGMSVERAPCGCTLLLYWQQTGPSPILVRASHLRKHWSG